MLDLPKEGIRLKDKHSFFHLIPPLKILHLFHVHYNYNVQINLAEVLRSDVLLSYEMKYKNTENKCVVIHTQITPGLSTVIQVFLNHTIVNTERFYFTNKS